MASVLERVPRNRRQLDHPGTGGALTRGLAHVLWSLPALLMLVGDLGAQPAIVPVRVARPARVQIRLEGYLNADREQSGERVEVMVTEFDGWLHK